MYWLYYTIDGTFEQVRDEHQAVQLAAYAELIVFKAEMVME